MKARKLPIVMDVNQWNGDITQLPFGVQLVMGIELGTSWSGDPDEAVAIIKTLEGNMIVSPGDWIVTGVNGERWPIKNDIFRKTYEIIE